MKEYFDVPNKLCTDAGTVKVGVKSQNNCSSHLEKLHTVYEKQEYIIVALYPYSYPYSLNSFPREGFLFQ